MPAQRAPSRFLASCRLDLTCWCRMLGRPVLDISIILRRFAAVEPPIVAHHANFAVPQALDAIDSLRHPAVGCA